MSWGCLQWSKKSEKELSHISSTIQHNYSTWIISRIRMKQAITFKSDLKNLKKTITWDEVQKSSLLEHIWWEKDMYYCLWSRVQIAHKKDCWGVKEKWKWHILSYLPHTLKSVDSDDDESYHLLQNMFSSYDKCWHTLRVFPWSYIQKPSHYWIRHYQVLLRMIWLI